jgi:hypothetical protein
MESLARRRAVIQQLVDSEGWKMFQTAMQSAAELSFNRMMDTNNAHEAVKCMAVYHTLRSVLDWPTREIRAIDQHAAIVEREALEEARRNS